MNAVGHRMKKLLLLTSGGDCPGLNGVIRAVVKAAEHDGNWQVYGSRRAYCGVLEKPNDIIHLTSEVVAGIHVRGGTILETVNKGNPTAFPAEIAGEQVFIDRSDELISIVKQLGFDAVINIIPREWLDVLKDADGEIDRIRVLLNDFVNENFWEALA